LVGSYGRGRYGRSTACGVTLERATLGIAHPVLPCGAKILVRFDGREAEAAVIDKGLETDHDFDLTAALAAELGVDGTQRVRWRFAGG
jgi:hypothetical protein